MKVDVHLNLKNQRRLQPMAETKMAALCAVGFWFKLYLLS